MKLVVSIYFNVNLLSLNSILMARNRISLIFKNHAEKNKKKSDYLTGITILYLKKKKIQCKVCETT